MSKPKLAVVIGSVRINRFADHPAQWIAEIAKQSGKFDVELIDLKDYPLPFFAEAASPAYAPSKNEVAQRWQKKLAEFDAYIFTVAEYNRGPADYDVTHTLSSNWIYELPWAAQKAYGGWQISGILYLRSGLPITITQSQSMLSTGITNNRPNTICDPGSDSATIDRWFNTSCFQQVADSSGTFGNTGRNTVRGPGDFNIDVSVIKNTKFGPVSSELRLEVFNRSEERRVGKECRL